MKKKERKTDEESDPELADHNHTELQLELNKNDSDITLTAGQVPAIQSDTPGASLKALLSVTTFLTQSEKHLPSLKTNPF